MTESRDAHELCVLFTVFKTDWDAMGIVAQRELVQDRFTAAADPKGLVVRYDGYAPLDDEFIEIGDERINLKEHGLVAIKATGWVIPNPGELDG